MYISERREKEKMKGVRRKGVWYVDVVVER
jgi:hypothetical protein